MYIFQDWRANKGNLKGRIFMILYRTAYLTRHNKICLVFLFWYLPLYRFFVEWVFGIEINWNVKIGHSLRLYHGQSLVIYAFTKIGDNCTLRHSTTLGNKEFEFGKFTNGPTLGNNVSVGAHVCILGDINIGDNVTIGAGSIVIKDVPENCVVVGNPARIIR